MSIETTVLDFKLSNNFEEYEAHMNAPEQQAMFKDPEVKPLIESAGHIYDSTVISSYF